MGERKIEERIIDLIYKKLMKKLMKKLKKGRIGLKEFFSIISSIRFSKRDWKLLLELIESKGWKVKASTKGIEISRAKAEHGIKQ